MACVELSISNGGYGGDFELDPNTGDLLLVEDTPGNPAATKQRLTRLLLTTPRSSDLGTNDPLGFPDDVCNPDYGAGLPALVGVLPTQRVLSTVQSNLAKIIAADPYVASTPVPSVTVTSASGGFLFVVITCDTSDGDPLLLEQVLATNTGS